MYADMLLTTGLSGISDKEIDAKLDDIISLYSCITDKEAYIASYTSLMSNRLLNNSSISLDIEESMVNKLAKKTKPSKTTKKKGKVVANITK